MNDKQFRVLSRFKEHAISIGAQNKYTFTGKFKKDL